MSYPQNTEPSEIRLADAGQYYEEDVERALRNRGMPLEALRHSLTPRAMHYLLCHFDVPYVDEGTWRLAVDAVAGRAVTWTLDELRSMPSVTQPVTMECAGNGRSRLIPRPVAQPWNESAVSTAEWKGVPLKHVLGLAGIGKDAVEIVFTALDCGVESDDVIHYERSLSIDEAMQDGPLLAYQMNGEPLPPPHGFPLRLVVPDWYGMASVKWLARITAVTQPFRGFYMENTYRFRMHAGRFGERVTLQRVRALLTPPGVPIARTGVRLVRESPVVLAGRAWSGRQDIAQVDVSWDDGKTWHRAVLESRLSAYAWRSWSYAWNTVPGHYVLLVRATNTAGESQPMTQDWNYEGMANNAVQRTRVVVS